MKALFVLLCLFALSACSHLPTLAPLADPSGAPAFRQRCRARFPQKALRLVHQIQAQLPLGRQSAMLGVSQVEPQARRLRAILLSLEGLTLLDAQRDAEGDEILRAFGPFADPDFAAGLLDDVALLLLEPPVQPEIGRIDMAWTCRYRSSQEVVDLIRPEKEGAPWRLLRYSPTGEILRSIEFSPEKAHIQAPGLGAYQLWLKLERKESLD